MADSMVLMGLFQDAGHAAETIDRLRGLGITDHDMTVLSGVPYSARVLGRPTVREWLPFISLAGALVGFLAGILLNVGTPLLYTIPVGGQGIIPIPPSAVITFELTMLGLIISTFLGVLWESAFPSYAPQYYDPLLTSGRIGVLFHCPADKEEAARAILSGMGAERIQRPERRPL